MIRKTQQNREIGQRRREWKREGKRERPLLGGGAGLAEKLKGKVDRGDEPSQHKELRAHRQVQVQGRLERVRLD